MQRNDKIRPYRPHKDKKAVQRIWIECGWIEDEKRHLDALDVVLSGDETLVREIGGAAECLVTSARGSWHHSGTPLPLAAITAVTTGRVARNAGAASETLARMLAERSAAGDVVSGLGVFEQGFYERLGYGAIGYEHTIHFDPAWLAPLGATRAPVRLSQRDADAIHSARLARRKWHGAVDLAAPACTRAELMFQKNGFGLGYREGDRITHCAVFSTESVAHGPYCVNWLVYQDFRQLRELFGAIRGLGDQVRQVYLREPHRVNVQSLLQRPFQLYTITKGGKYHARNEAETYSQLRILDLPACIAALKPRARLRFGLRLHDPISAYLPEDAPWRGVAGDWIIDLGTTSRATPGYETGLPVLEADVGDITRWWAGAAGAESLAGFGSLRGAADLIAALDRVIDLPRPEQDWDY